MIIIIINLPLLLLIINIWIIDYLSIHFQLHYCYFLLLIILHYLLIIDYLNILPVAWLLLLSVYHSYYYCYY